MNKTIACWLTRKAADELREAEAMLEQTRRSVDHYETMYGSSPDVYDGGIGKGMSRDEVWGDDLRAAKRAHKRQHRKCADLRAVLTELRKEMR